MNIDLSYISPYIIPPFLSFIFSLTLGIITLTRGKWDEEHILLFAVLFGWSLLTPVFVLHHLIGNQDVLLKIERFVHFFYVFTPPITVRLIHYVAGVKRYPTLFALIGISLLFAFTTQTEYYFNGFYKFEWGLIARGGIAFDLFGVYSVAIVGYVLVFCWRRYRREKNPLRKLKIQYINISFLIVSILTLLNIPAIKGINFYPVGNFIFIPLSILTYGILKHRLLSLRVILHITIPRIIFQSLILLPNFLLLYFLKPYLTGLDIKLLYALLLTWYMLNHYYIRHIQPRLDEYFRQRKEALVQEKLEERREKYRISHIKGIDLEDLGRKIEELMKDEKVYCDEDLTLARLADMLELSSHQLSEYLNRHLAKNFYSFINEYRIQEAKILLKEPGRSVLTIALNVGYNSKSAFYRAFVKETGMTPNKFRAEAG